MKLEFQPSREQIQNVSPKRKRGKITRELVKEDESEEVTVELDQDDLPKIPKEQKNKIEKAKNLGSTVNINVNHSDNFRKLTAFLEENDRVYYS